MESCIGTLKRLLNVGGVGWLWFDWSEQQVLVLVKAMDTM